MDAKHNTDLSLFVSFRLHQQTGTAELLQLTFLQVLIKIKYTLHHLARHKAGL